jgi:acid phosphatase family membrane protein YuiD
VGYNPYILIPLATWAIAQVTKFAIAAFGGRLDFRYLYSSGGMPSVHSAVVCSLAVTAFLVGGANSAVFGLSVIFAAIVMYDSFGVRRSSGEQAAAINMIVDSLDKGRIKLDRPDVHLREILGHQPKEVTAGALLGIVLAGLFNYDKLTPLVNFMQTPPSRTELWAYAALFAILVIGGLVQRLILRSRYPKSRTIKKLTSQILTAAETVGWLGLLAVVFQYERASYLAWRFWALAIIAIGVVWAVIIISNAVKTVPGAMTMEANEARKLKWLGLDRKRKPKRT